MDNTDNVTWLAKKRDGTADAVVGILPHLPIRIALIAAYQDAMGLREVEGGGLEQTADPEVEDLLAIGFAILGVCWQQPPIEAASFRECGRDPVEFGEAFMTSIARAGYHTEGLVAASGEVMIEMYKSIQVLMGEVSTEAQGFEEAQGS